VGGFEETAAEHFSSRAEAHADFNNRVFAICHQARRRLHRAILLDPAAYTSILLRFPA
jgi:hypothetical protein